MKRQDELTSAEFELMQMLWSADEPIKIQELCDFPQNEWNYSTIATMLTRMKEKGAVIAEKHGKTYFYSPAIDREHYTKAQTQKLIEKLYNGSVKNLAASLFKNDGITKEDIAELRQLLDE